MSENVLSVTDLEKAFGDRTIADGITFGLDRGVKLGLIGANGAGKSTLLRMIAGLEESEGGRVVVRGDCRIAFLEQDPPLPSGATAREILEVPLTHLKAVVESGDLERAEELGAWDWEHRMERAAQECGISDLDGSVDTMSGGQRKRVALARMVLEGADLLMLDEPTNHLDTETSDWLERWLANSEATAILVTHDRYFLDRVVDFMAELRDGQIRIYSGNYTEYLEARTLEEAHRSSVRKRRLQLLKMELEWARRAPKARRTKAKARLGRIDEATAEQRRLETEELVADFRFGDPPRLGKTVLELTDLRKRYDAPLIEGLSLIVRRGERFGIIGPNGCGKSTLLELIGGALHPDGGTLKQGTNTRVAWLDQERSFLDENATVRSTLLPDGGEFVFPNGRKLHVNGWLQRFAFLPEQHPMKVGSLSGGERNRLAIARFLLEEANLLLLDEPTNDIDLTTLNVLEEALARFEGCVLVVSHDRFFLDKIATGIIAFEGPGEVSVVQGDYTHYRRVRLGQLDREREAAQAEKQAQRRASREATQSTREARGGLSWKERQELAGMEERVEAADAQVGFIEEQLADPQLWSTDHEGALALDRRLGEARAASQALWSRWEELMAKEEQA